MDRGGWVVPGSTSQYGGGVSVWGLGLTRYLLG